MLKRFGAPIGKAALSFSLLVGGLALAVDYAKVSRELRAAPSDEAKTEILTRLSKEPDIDPELQEDLDGLARRSSYAISMAQAEKMIELRAFAQSTKPAPAADKNPAEEARSIKSSPLFRDVGQKKQGNWFSKGFERLGDWLSRVFSRNRRQEGPGGIDIPNLSPLMTFFVYFVWALLAAALAFLLYFAIRHFSWKSKLERRAKAVLEEDEPELSRDEYLAEAQALVEAGKYREAVRYLYLACLLALDEMGVARFVRGETNWEHLRRIEASPLKPTDLDLRSPTRRFDEVWYGMRVRGLADVDELMATYRQLADKLGRKAA